MLACAAESGGGCSGPSWRAGCAWWWPRWPSGWGWTGRTCGRCCTWGCPPALRPTCRQWVVQGVTGSRHTATSSSGPRWVPTPPPAVPPSPPGAVPHVHATLPQGQDLRELRRHVHANAVDFFAVKRLVQRVFPPCACARQPPEQEGSRSEEGHLAGAPVAASAQDSGQPNIPHTPWCPCHERVLPVQPTVQALDMPEEGEERVCAAGVGVPTDPE